VNVEIRGGGYEYRPVILEERVWVEPLYRTVCDRVWVEPVMQREVYDRVWVPDRYEWRETVCWEYGRRVVRGVSVLVEPGHFEDRCRDVVIVPGHYEDRPRQELVSPGHWETRCETRPVESCAQFGVRFPVRW
jgi:hypothetical protein